jgi:hypothetical protein
MGKWMKTQSKEPNLPRYKFVSKDACDLWHSYITPIHVLAHFVFHSNLNEIEQIYHGKSGQPHSE